MKFLDGNRKRKTAKLIGAIYFLLLGLVNLGATWAFAEINNLDIIIIAIACLPMIINKNYFSISFGVLSTFIAVFLGYACFMFHVDPNISTSAVSFFMGYLLSASMLVASFLLIYGASQVLRENVVIQ